MGEKAYTLVELMVALSVASIFVTATLMIVNTAARNYYAQERVSDAQQSLRAGLDLMARDIRMAGYDPMAVSQGSKSRFGILSATNTMIQISADLNADREDNGGVENLTYYYDAENRRLRRKEGGNAYPQTFIENVSALNFRYFDATGDPVTDLDEVVAVEMTLTVKNRNARGGIFERTLRTRINCRNLKL